MRTRHALLAAAPTVLVLACGRGQVTGSGHTRSEPRSIQGFSEVTFASAGDLTIVQSGTESLTIEADDNVLPHLTSTLSGGRLTLGTDASVHPSKTVRYTLNVKDLSVLDLTGAGDVAGFGLHLSALRVSLSGGGSIKLSGQADGEEIELSGAGDIDASQLASKTAKVTVSGAGRAVVQVSDTLEADVTGAGNVQYVGNPKVTQHVSGAGAVSKR